MAPAQAAVRTIEIRPRETLPPGFEDRFEHASFKVWARPVLEQRNDAGARDRGVDEEIGGTAEAHRRRPRTSAKISSAITSRRVSG